MPQPTFSEIKLVTLGVGDLDRSIAFYADAFDLEEASRTRVDHEALTDLWRIPQGISGRFAVMGLPGIDSGMLRLIEWTPSGDPVWAPPARIQDLGPFAVNFRVKDVHAAWERLGQAGAKPKSAPTYWEVNESIAAWDSQCFDPDGTLLDVFQVVGKIEAELGPFAAGRDASEVQTLAVHCSDARRSEAFYLGLGFETLYDKVVEDLEHFFGVPKGTKLHNINLIMRGLRPTGRIELAQYVGLLGRSLKTRTAPPSRGPQMMSLRVTSVDDGAALLTTLGAKEIGAGRYNCPPFGEVRARTLFGPDDEVIELFEV